MVPKWGWPIVNAVAVVCCVIVAAFADEARAQASGWDEGWDNSCARFERFGGEASVKVSLAQLLKRWGKLPVAHRGVFSVALPDGKTFAAENTILAFQYSQCLGYVAVEVDVKSTADGAIVLNHDFNMMRFNNIDGDDGEYILDRDAGVVFEGVQTRSAKTDANGQIIAGPNVDQMNWQYIEDQYAFVKLYDQDGHQIEGSEGKNDYPQKILLEDVLAEALTSNDSGMEKLIWILDIQRYDQTAAVLDVVRNLSEDFDDIWNRVIFKAWASAVPVEKDADGYRISFSQRYPGARFVLSINAADTAFDAEANDYVTTFSNRDGSSTEKLTLDDIRSLPKTIGSSVGGEVDGFEVFISGEESNIALDEVLTEWAHVLANTAENEGPSWGVVRYRDYLRENCDTIIDPFSCEVFPDGNYDIHQHNPGGDTTKTYLSLETTPDEVARKRQQFGKSQRNWIVDIRTKSAYVTPLAHGALFSAIF